MTDEANIAEAELARILCGQLGRFPDTMIYRREGHELVESHLAWTEWTEVARALLAAGYRKRSDVLEEAAKVADAHAEPQWCDNLGQMDMETGVSDCSLELRGASCSCADRMEAAQLVSEAIRSLKGQP